MLGRNQVEHNSQRSYYRSPVGAAEAGGEVKVGLTIRTKEAVTSVLLRLWTDREGEKLIPLTTKDDYLAERRYYSAHIPMPDSGCLVWYYFIISQEGATTFYGNNQEQLGGEGDVYDHVPPSFQLTVFDKGAKTPDWFKHSVMYQIFPDRFCRVGDEIIPKKGAVYHADWSDDPCYYKDPDTKEIVAYDFFGGNLKGIESKLDYLKDLGISVIYLNPVFESESNHHYDTGDYHKIDPILGTNEEFKKLVDLAHKKGMRIILDGVFSHTGSNSKYFNRAGQYDTVGAFQSKDSPYYEWYNFRNFPYEYECWWNFDTLPDVTETTPSYMDFIINDKESVLHHWLGEGINGWRLDVIDELPAAFSQAFYKELKKTNPEAVMIGEVWEDASNKVAYGQPREYLCGHEMDSAMNYPFRQILLDYLLGRGDADFIMRRFESLRENYPRENFYAMMNLIGSHDVQRAITLLGEAAYYEGMPAVDQSRSRLTDDQYRIGRARLIMAIVWQMVYPGVPSIYYGDEVGMQGFKDPYNRRPYLWEGGDEELRAIVRKLVHLRNDHMALQTGDLLPLHAAGDVLAFARTIRGESDLFGEEADDEAFVIAFNRNRTDRRSVTLDVSDFADGTFVDVFSEDTKFETDGGKVTVKVPPLSAVLLQYRAKPRKYERKAGILLHPTSLPSKYGCGDLGPEAYKFVDFLESAGQKVWQILPLGPVGYGYSPYQSTSAFAGNPLLIDLDALIERGWLTANDVRLSFVGHSSFVDFERVDNFKQKALKKAYGRFAKDKSAQDDFAVFCEREAYWLDDFALFMAGKKEHRDKAWFEWTETLKKRTPKAIAELKKRHSDVIGLVKFTQYVFFMQWKKLHDYANAHGVEILGDMPIFVAHDSADVWAHPELFDLADDGSARTVAGVPPDYFSSTGQLWGNPQYDWTAMKKTKYAWWKSRFKKLYDCVDIVRIDHFRGFESYWEVDGKAETAINGCWRKGPGKPFFDEIKEALGKAPIVAEDLGIITKDVERLRDDCGFPGMKVLHFTLHFNECGRMGFVAPENSIIYTGTHDNNTTVGWFTKDIDEATRSAVAELLHADEKKPEEVAKKLITFAYASDARMAIIPMQDLLALDDRGRMNTPGTVGLNWKWCLKPGYLVRLDAARLKKLCAKYER